MNCGRLIADFQPYDGAIRSSQPAITAGPYLPHVRETREITEPPGQSQETFRRFLLGLVLPRLSGEPIRCKFYTTKHLPLLALGPIKKILAPTALQVCDDCASENLARALSGRDRPSPAFGRNQEFLAPSTPRAQRGLRPQPKPILAPRRQERQEERSSTIDRLSGKR